MQQLWGRAGAVVSTCMQQLGAGLDRGAGTQTQSDAIRCHHVPSTCFRCHQMSSDAIRCHHVPSTCFRCHQMSPQMPSAHLTCAMRTKPIPHAMCNQMQSDALCASHLCHAHKAHPACHVQSDALRCTQISPVPCAQSPSRMPCATASNRRQGPSG